jgi:hypothetical protein
VWLREAASAKLLAWGLVRAEVAADVELVLAWAAE